MGRFRSYSETRRPRNFYNSDAGSSGGYPGEAEADFVSMVRNCSSCLDLYHRMIEMSAPSEIPQVEHSGDGVATNGEGLEIPEQDANLPEPIGEGNDYEAPERTDRRMSPSMTGSCVFLFKKETANWHAGRDWQDLFDFELVVVDPIPEEQVSGSSVPLEGHGTRGTDQIIEENPVDENETPSTGSSLPTVRFDKNTDTNNDDSSYQK